jgi:hypothetical protein
LTWFDEQGYRKPPKSSCLGCPYHSDEQWLEIKQEYPDEWLETVEMDRMIRNIGKSEESQQFMHRSLKPLDEVVFKPKEKVSDMFNNECEGMCGV